MIYRAEQERVIFLAYGRTKVLQEVFMDMKSKNFQLWVFFLNQSTYFMIDIFLEIISFSKSKIWIFGWDICDGVFLDICDGGGLS